MSEALLDIEKTLKPKPQRQTPLKQSTPSAIDLSTALLKLPEISETLTALLKEKNRQTDLMGILEKYDFELQTLIAKTNMNVEAVGKIQVAIDERLKTFEVLESKYKLMITRINSVLDELERVLKQL